MQGKEADIEYESERQDLLQYCHAQKQLIDMYIAIEELKHLHEGPDSELDKQEDKERTIADLLHVTLTEAKALLHTIEKYKITCLNSGSCHQNIRKSNINIAVFLSCFHVEINNVPDTGGQSSSGKDSGQSASGKTSIIEIRDALSKDMSIVLGLFIILFKCFDERSILFRQVHLFIM